MGGEQVGIEPADGEGARLVGQPAVVAADEVRDHRVAGLEHMAVGSLAQHRVGARAAQGRVAVARDGAARAGQHLAVVHLLVEAAEPKLTLVARQPEHSLNL